MNLERMYITIWDDIFYKITELLYYARAHWSTGECIKMRVCKLGIDLFDSKVFLRIIL